ncbi:uncharacterized protein LOC135349586 [Halichondria panicea]|uniref:uncharacterized protein LOC135349586 n=1 Tax=Halichondria panicea TaxID=6063 RepID=UPI00312B3702
MFTARLFAALTVSLLLSPSYGHYLSPYDFLQYDIATIKLDASVTVSVSPSALEKSGSWVNVSWEGVASPSDDDWVGVYSPPVGGSIDPVKHAPVKFQYANFNKSHMTSGSGSLRFRLVNMRDDIIMGFFTGGFEKPVLVAVSNLVSFKNFNEPLQGHLAFAGDPTQMIVVWVTKDSAQPEVVWGMASGQYTYHAKAVSSMYTDKDMCGGPATGVGYRDAGTLHQATMNNLSPGQIYYYKYGDASDASSSWSEEASFRAALPAGPDQTVRVIAYGDMGNGQPDDSRQTVTGQQPALNTTKLVLGQLDRTDLVLHIGDISYARGYASVWDEFFDQIQAVATRVPYMVCIGNHERDFPQSKSYYDGTDSGGECGVPHERRFPMPRPSLDEAWYEFDYGPVHFFLMSTEHNFTVGSPQYNYMKARLSMVDRSKTPWLVFAGHRPMYIDSTNDSPKSGDLPVSELLRATVEPLLKESKVDLAMWGHHHSYQRTCPVFNSVCTEGATTHVVIGMGGQGLSKNIHLIKPAYMEVVDVDHWGYSWFSANATTLLFQFVRDSDGKIHDQLVLHKN